MVSKVDNLFGQFEFWLTSLGCNKSRRLRVSARVLV
jgi:hypothetical protein